MRAQLVLAAFLLAAASAHADDLSFTGFARSLDTGELLYIESHSVSGAGTPREKRVVLYRCAAGEAPFARKQLEYGADRETPTFEFEDARSGFIEGLRREDDGLTVFDRAGAVAPLRSQRVVRTGSLIADAGFDEFVRAQWDALERGTSLTEPFLVPSLQGSVNFRVRKVGETRIDGERTSVVRLSLAGPLGWFLSDIDVSYRKSDRRLMRYRGLTNIRDARGELLKAQIDFPATAASDDPVDLAPLRALPLVADCR